MSYGFLPLSVFLLLCLTGSVFFFLIGMKRKNIDRKGLIVLYFTLSIGSLFSALIKVIKETTKIYLKYFDIFGYFLIAYCSIILIELIYLSITYNGDKKKRKLLLIGWGIVVIPALVLIIDILLL